MPRDAWPPYRTVRDLIHAHVGRPGVVIGGGPSRTAAIAATPTDAIFISTNDHGLRELKRHPAPPRRIHYTVACDRIERRARYDIGKGGDATAWGVPVISRHMWADYRLLFLPGKSSGMAAAWLLRLMGCTPIILTGMDLYTGGTYADDPTARSSGKTVAAVEHLRRWRVLAKAYPAMYRVIGCDKRLAADFGYYDPEETPARAVPFKTIAEGIGGRWAQVTRSRLISQRPFDAGPAAIEFSAAEVEELMRDRSGKPVAR